MNIKTEFNCYSTETEVDEKKRLGKKRNNTLK